MRKKLIVFVEGDDDQMFFENIIKPYLSKEISDVEYFQYAEKSTEGIKARLRALKDSPENIDYLFLSDKDQAEDIEEKLGRLTEKFEPLENSKTHVAVIEIESWYFAGLTPAQCDEFGIPYFEDTSNKNKRDFMSELSEGLYRNNNFMESFLINITVNYSLDEAKDCNDSFKKFCDAIGI